MSKPSKGLTFLQETCYRVARFFSMPFFTWRFRISADSEPKLPPPYVVIANHVSELDFVYVAKVFKTPIGFVVGSGLLQNRLMRFLVVRLFASIPKQKGMADPRTTLGMLRRLQAGRNVGLFAEGNTTFDGRTGPFPQATGALLRAVRAGLVTCRIEGGYFTLPRWGFGIRRGVTACRVVNTYTKETLAGMSTEAINQALASDLMEDAYARQARAQMPFRGKNKAVGLEHALYLCPLCDSQNTLRGDGDTLRCHACGGTAEYTDLGTLKGAFPHKTILEWTAWQKERLRSLLSISGDGPVVADPRHSLLIQDNKGELSEHAAGAMGLGRQGLVIGDFHASPLDITGFEIYRKNIIQFTLADGRHFQTAELAGFNALKYRDLLEIIRETGA